MTPARTASAADLHAMDCLLPIRTVQKRVGLSSTSIYRLMAEADFPQPVKVGPKAVRWSSREIEHWVALRPRGGTERVR